MSFLSVEPIINRRPSFVIRQPILRRRARGEALVCAALGAFWLLCLPSSLFAAPFLSRGSFLKITTTNGGLQTLSASAIADVLGQSVTNISASLAQGGFSLSNLGRPIRWLASPGADALLFYAQPHADNYGSQNVFWLTQSTNLPAIFLNGQAPLPGINSSYPAALLQEVDALPALSLPIDPRADYWMWTKLVALGAFFNSASFSFNLDHLASNSTAPAQLTLQLWGFDAAGHRVSIWLNGAALGTNDWSGITPTNPLISFPAAKLLSGANRLTLYALTNTAVSPGPTSQWYLNKFQLGYPRLCFAYQGMLDCTANNNSVLTIDGFTSPAITVLNLDDVNYPAVVTNATVATSSAGFRVSFVPASPSSHCLAFQAGAGFPVNSLAVGQVLGLAESTNAADYLIVTPTNFLAAATNLALYRQQTGLRSLVVPLDPIANEFNAGFPGPEGIQGLLAAAYTNWITPPRYVVLFGDGTYDYRNLLGYGDNLVPPLLIPTPYGLFCSDSLYGDVNGDGFPEIAIGRLSGHSPADMNNLVNKVIQYEAQPLPVSPKAILIADAPDNAGDFDADISALDAILVPKFSDTILRADGFADAITLRFEITNAWSQGPDFLAYVGHGAIDRFGSQGYVTIAEATNLLNSGRWPVVSATTCVAGQFSVPGNDCIGEYLVRQNRGGAVAMFSPTGLSWDSEASPLNDRLFKYLRSNTLPRLGDCVRLAVSDFVRFDNPGMPVWIYNLLGDPALRVNLRQDLLMGTPVREGDSLLLVWSGGTPPYQIQASSSLGVGAVWSPLGSPTTATNLLLTPGNGAFFRVLSGP